MHLISTSWILITHHDCEFSVIWHCILFHQLFLSHQCYQEMSAILGIRHVVEMKNWANHFGACALKKIWYHGVILDTVWCHIYCCFYKTPPRRSTSLISMHYQCINSFNQLPMSLQLPYTTSFQYLFINFIDGSIGAKTSFIYIPSVKERQSAILNRLQLTLSQR